MACGNWQILGQPSKAWQEPIVILNMQVEHKAIAPLNSSDWVLIVNRHIPKKLTSGQWVVFSSSWQLGTKHLNLIELSLSTALPKRIKIGFQTTLLMHILSKLSPNILSTCYKSIHRIVPRHQFCQQNSLMNVKSYKSIISTSALWAALSQSRQYRMILSRPSWWCRIFSLSSATASIPHQFFRRIVASKSGITLSSSCRGRHWSGEVFGKGGRCRRWVEGQRYDPFKRGTGAAELGGWERPSGSCEVFGQGGRCRHRSEGWGRVDAAELHGLLWPSGSGVVFSRRGRRRRRLEGHLGQNGIGYGGVRDMGVGVYCDG